MPSPNPNPTPGVDYGSPLWRCVDCSAPAFAFGHWHEDGWHDAEPAAPPGPFRGVTFREAEEWRLGGRRFALSRLEEVGMMLRNLAHEEAEALIEQRRRRFGRRRRRRPSWQRTYDLIDAGRTVTDAIARLR